MYRTELGRRLTSPPTLRTRLHAQSRQGEAPAATDRRAGVPHRNARTIRRPCHPRRRLRAPRRPPRARRPGPVVRPKTVTPRQARDPAWLDGPPNVRAERLAPDTERASSSPPRARGTTRFRQGKSSSSQERADAPPSERRRTSWRCPRCDSVARIDEGTRRDKARRSRSSPGRDVVLWAPHPNPAIDSHLKCPPGHAFDVESYPCRGCYPRDNAASNSVIAVPKRTYQMMIWLLMTCSNRPSAITLQSDDDAASSGKSPRLRIEANRGQQPLARGVSKTGRPNPWRGRAGSSPLARR